MIVSRVRAVYHLGIASHPSRNSHENSLDYRLLVRLRP